MGLRHTLHFGLVQPGSYAFRSILFTCCLKANNGPPAVGRTEITELARSFMTSFPDLRVVMGDVRIHEDCAEYYWTLTGTDTGPGGGDHRIHISGFEKWRMGADGLRAASQGHFDAAEYQRQLEQGV